MMCFLYLRQKIQRINSQFLFIKIQENLMTL